MTNTVAKDQRRDSQRNRANHPHEKNGQHGRNDKETPKGDRQESYVQENLRWSFAT